MKFLLLVPAIALVASGVYLSPVGDSSHGTAVIPCQETLPGVGVVCPDLIVDAAKLNVQQRVTQTFSASSCNVIEGHTQPGERKLIRFYFSSPNVGLGDLVVGRPASHPEWFEFPTCHGHYHFREYADYRLWTPEGFAQWEALRLANPSQTAAQVLAANPGLLAEFKAGNKMGFCVIDIFPYAPALSPTHPLGRFHSCSNNQGITAGWADEYSPGLDGQWIDVTNVAAGLYILEAEVNAERLYVESDYTNNRAYAPMVVV